MTAVPGGRLDPVAERRKLAHALDVDHAELGMLTDVPAHDLRTLRQQVSDALFEADRHHFTRIAALSKAVPVAVVAKLTEVALPPLVAARTAELLEPHRAVELVGRLSPGYLASVAAVMDAGRASHIVGSMPASVVAAVGTELARREEWVVMGGFVAHVDEPALQASVAELTGEQLLRISFVLEDLARLDAIGDMLTDDQLDGMLVAAAEFELWRELAELVANLSQERIDRFAGRLPSLPDGVVDRFAAARSAGVLPGDVAEALTVS